jgi:recombination protein RecT
MNPSPTDRWFRPTSKAGLDALVSESLLAEINKGCPPFLRGQADRLVRTMITECSRNPALLDCSPASLFGGVIQAGQLGLVIGGPLGECYLVPFSNRKKQCKEAALIVGYKGYLQLAHRSAMVRRITPRVVRKGDGFTVRYGSDQVIIHSPVRNSREEATDFYTVVETVTGGLDFEVITREEAVAHRDRYSLAKDSGPWADMSVNGGFEAMAMKTTIRKLAKRLPMSPEMSTATGLEDMAEQGQPQMLSAHLSGLPEPERPRDDEGVEARAERAMTPTEDEVAALCLQVATKRSVSVSAVVRDLLLAVSNNSPASLDDLTTTELRAAKKWCEERLS